MRAHRLPTIATPPFWGSKVVLNVHTTMGGVVITPEAEVVGDERPRHPGALRRGRRRREPPRREPHRRERDQCGGHDGADRGAQRRPAEALSRYWFTIVRRCQEAAEGGSAPASGAMMRSYGGARTKGDHLGVGSFTAAFRQPPQTAARPS